MSRAPPASAVRFSHSDAHGWARSRRPRPASRRSREVARCLLLLTFAASRASREPSAGDSIGKSHRRVMRDGDRSKGSPGDGRSSDAADDTRAWRAAGDDRHTRWTPRARCGGGGRRRGPRRNGGVCRRDGNHPRHNRRLRDRELGVARHGDPEPRRPTAMRAGRRDAHERRGAGKHDAAPVGREARPAPGRRGWARREAGAVLLSWGGAECRIRS